MLKYFNVFIFFVGIFVCFRDLVGCVVEFNSRFFGIFFLRVCLFEVGWIVFWGVFRLGIFDGVVFFLVGCGDFSFRRAGSCR